MLLELVIVAADSRYPGRGSVIQDNDQQRAQAHSIHSSRTDAASRQPRSSRLPWTREHWVLASLSALLGSFVIAIVPGFANAMREPELPLATVEIELPPAPESVGALPDEGTADSWRTVSVKPGQTMGQIFGELGLSAGLLHQLLQDEAARRPLTMIRVGQEFSFDIPAPGELRAIRFDRDDRHVELAIEGGRVQENVSARDVQRRVMMASGTLTHSLYGAGERAGLAPATINELANVFEHDIDFTRDIREGDSFNVIYEEIWRDGERLRNGGIVAATFINRGKRHTALRFERDGKFEYFDAEGRPIQRGFLRMPIEFARISSRFNPNRRHPVLGTIRAHRGVDYAAPTGTPIRAAGNGRITFAGWQNGYGRTIIIDHGGGITTLYAHMSRLGSYRVGQRVSQSNVIGYVGATGLASGPHLHYEFRVNGVHRDPLTVTFPKPEPLPPALMAQFRQQTTPVLAQLELLEGRQLAAVTP